MNNICILLIIIFFLASFFVEFYFKKRRNNALNKLLKLLYEKKFKEFDSYVAQLQNKKIVPLYNLEFLKFNSYVLRQNDFKEKVCFDKIASMHLTERQRFDFFIRAFSVYIENKNKVLAKKSLKQIDSIKNKAETKKNLHMIYDVVILNDTSYLPMLLARVPKENKQAKLSDYYLIRHIYKLKKDIKTENKYFNLLSETAKNLKKKA